MPYEARLLSGIGVLDAVVQGDSFVRAAEMLGLSDSGIGRAVARLEARIGIRLFDRTTRSLRMTDEGTRFYAEVSPLLVAIATAAAEASGSGSAVRARLRVDVDPFFARLMLAPRLPKVLARHPHLELDFVTREKAGDLVRDGIDVALRFGPSPIVSRVSCHLLDTRILTVAAPLISRATAARPRPPTSRGTAGSSSAASRRASPSCGSSSGALTLGGVGLMLDAGLAGTCIAQVLALETSPFITSERLVNLFPDWPGETFPLQAVTPSRHQPPAKIRAFLDACLTAVRDLAL